MGTYAPEFTVYISILSGEVEIPLYKLHFVHVLCKMNFDNVLLLTSLSRGHTFGEIQNALKICTL